MKTSSPLSIECSLSSFVNIEIPATEADPEYGYFPLFNIEIANIPIVYLPG